MSEPNRILYGGKLIRGFYFRYIRGYQKSANFTNRDLFQVFFYKNNPFASFSRPLFILKEKNKEKRLW